MAVKEKTETKKKTKTTPKPKVRQTTVSVVKKTSKSKIAKKPKAVVAKEIPSKESRPVKLRRGRISKKEQKPVSISEVKDQQIRVISVESATTPEVIKSTAPTMEVKIPPLVSAPPEPVKETIKEIEPPKVEVKEPEFKKKNIELKFPITVKDLALKLAQKPSVIIKALMDMKVMAGINQVLEEQVVLNICDKFGYSATKAPEDEELALSIHNQIDAPAFLKPRFPIVTFMGHVDHGKTSLLDSIRKTKVAESEHGGITQHIGACRVILPNGEITFLDTPGHEAFTAMRARGASITDIVVLVVAADDGVMPQTREAIDHARAAGVPIIVAINKIDKPQANIDRVKKQLAELNLTAEDWGGKTITVNVSAKTGEGIDELLEMILLEAQMLELKANPNKPAKGVVLEAKLSKGKGPVSTLLIQNGSLRLGDHIIAGNYYGKIRAMFDDRGHAVVEAGPSFAIEVLGLTGIPQAGDQFFVLKDEKTAKDLALKRQEKEKLQQIKTIKRISLEDLHSQIKEGRLKELNLILKADVQGSLEAIRQTLSKIETPEIKIVILHEGVGNINSSDVLLAAASDALILGFHVEADERAKELISKEGIDVRTYNIIYELSNDIKAALEGMLEPKLKKVFLGRADVRKVFKLSRPGTVAGCFVSKGRILRSASVNLIRNGESIFEGSISNLKRFKDDVREVAEGFECGITLSGFDDIKEGDVIEAYQIERIARKL